MSETLTVRKADNGAGGTSTIRYDVDSDGIVVLTLDDPNASANTMNERYVTSMTAVVDRLYAEKDEITGAVVTSAKKTFFGGGDLVSMTKATPEDAEGVFTMVQQVKADLRRLALLGKPVVAASPAPCGCSGYRKR